MRYCQYTGTAENFKELSDFLYGDVIKTELLFDGEKLQIYLLENGSDSRLYISPGDYIIQSSNGVYLAWSKEFFELYNFRNKYKVGQKVFLVVRGEGIYMPIITEYDSDHNRYKTNTCWYILPNSLVFETEEELEEYRKENKIAIYHGSSEWCYSSENGYSYI